MGKTKGLDTFCVGLVTVIMDNNFVFTGRVSKERSEAGGEEFITMRLTSPPLIIPGNAMSPAPTQPPYQSGDVIRLNVDEVVTVGPANSVSAPVPAPAGDN